MPSGFRGVWVPEFRHSVKSDVLIAYRIVNRNLATLLVFLQV